MGAEVAAEGGVVEPRKRTSLPPSPRFVIDVLTHAAAAALALATVVLAGQPIYANDTWIHLALGEVFAAQGPWLSVDPHLFAAPGPPSPSSWLGSVAIFAAQSLLGFTGLRLLHALLVAAILVLAWRVVERATASARSASVGVVAFVLLSTYRLVQLRPDLFTIAATLVLVLLLVAPRKGPGRGAIAVSALLTGLWANLHAAFLLGPILVLGVSASLFALPALPGPSPDPLERRRAARLALAGLLMLVASLANPQGWNAHLAYFAAGGQTLGLAAVADEWGPTNLLAWPAANLPPTWAAWIVAWGCIVAVLLGGWAVLAAARDESQEEKGALDPALLALAVAGVVALVFASRFLWMGLFAVALGLALPRARPGLGNAVARRAAPISMLAGVVLAIAIHLLAGDWVLVSRTIRSAGADYRAPYYAAKFNGHAMWFLADSGVEGRIYNDYPAGGFMSFWLSPALAMASSGTMNVEREAMEANLAIATRQRVRDDEDFAALLDRMGFDLFLGTGLPIESIPGKRNPSTVRLLETESGWIQVYRNLRSAIYLRRDARNAENLTRVRDYYAAAGVPFDPRTGFDPERAIAAAAGWAVEQGIVPRDFPRLLESVRGASARRLATPEMHRLATLYATLGLYERALEVDRRILRANRADAEAARRMLWCLLHLRRVVEALEIARDLESGPLAGVASAGWIATLERIREAAPDERARLLAFIPLFRSDRASSIRSGMVLPRARERVLARR